jgi:cytochrome P450
MNLADVAFWPVSGRGHMDLIADFAFLLPVTVISDMLGIPEEDREVFFTGSRFGGRLLDLEHVPPELTR